MIQNESANPPEDSGDSEDESDKPCFSHSCHDDDSATTDSKCKSESESEEAADQPKLKDEPKPPQPPDPGQPGPEIVAGIVSFDVAKGKSICLVCNEPIPAGAWRLRYRTRGTVSSYRDLRYVHDFCAAGLPKSTRRHDIEMVEGFGREPRRPDEYVVLDNILEALQGTCGTYMPGASSTGT